MIDSICDWLKNNLGLGIFLTILIYTFCSIVFLAGLLLTLTIGFIYYQVLGSVV
jgi:uncharacterized membrane protein YdjX (TVP38/TMEM64 family)